MHSTRPPDSSAVTFVSQPRDPSAFVTARFPVGSPPPKRFQTRRTRVRNVQAAPRRVAAAVGRRTVMFAGGRGRQCRRRLQLVGTGREQLDESVDRRMDGFVVSTRIICDYRALTVDAGRAVTGTRLQGRRLKFSAPLMGRNCLLVQGALVPFFQCRRAIAASYALAVGANSRRLHCPGECDEQGYRATTRSCSCFCGVLHSSVGLSRYLLP